MKTLQWFTDNYQDLINLMKEASHNLSDTELSPYHAEGSVFTHTMMVYNQLDINASVELKLAVLLHDIGKPFCQVIREGKGRISFTGHEHYSSFKAIDILLRFNKEVENINIENILFAINYHDLLHKAVKENEDGIVFIPEDIKEKLNYMFETKLELYELLFDLSFADMRGRLSEDMELSIRKYNLLREYFPYRGTQIIHDKDAIVHFLVGLPGSGKSTLAKKLLKDNPELEYISVDDEILKIGKYSFSYDGAFSKENLKEANKVILQKIEDYVNENKSFIIDATNFSEKIRLRRLSKVGFKYKKVAHVLLSGESFIKDSMAKRNDKSLSMDIIYDMSKDFLYPSLYHFHEVKTYLQEKK